MRPPKLRMPLPVDEAVTALLQVKPPPKGKTTKKIKPKIAKKP